MKIYHGSDVIVDSPKIFSANRPLDFGGLHDGQRISDRGYRNLYQYASKYRIKLIDNAI